MSTVTNRIVTIFFVLIAIPSFSFANVIVTPFIGYSIGGTATDRDNKTYDISPSSSLALAVEFPLLNGRIGAFYSQQNSSLDTLDLDSKIQYLQLQSSAEYQVANKTLAYIGAGVRRFTHFSRLD